MARSRRQQPGQRAGSERDESSAPKPESPAGDSPRKAALDWQRRAGNRAVSDAVQRALHGSGEPLKPAIRSRMEARLGLDLSRVRVHTGARGEQAARLSGSKAFTVGRDIVFGKGQYAPETRAGSELLAHELVHVVQQRGEGPASRAADLEGEAQAAGARLAAGQAVQVAGQGGTAFQAAPDDQKKLPPAVVTAASAAVYPTPAASGTGQDVLKQYHAVEEIVEKRKVQDSWWYRIRYKVGDAEKTGWSLGENFSEVAQPGTFKFETPGSSGIGSPFEALREVVKEDQLEPNIARLVNFMNLVVLPTPGLALADFVGKSFFHALVEAKGNFKRASALMTAAVRAFKSSSGGMFPWVQAKTPKTGGFDPATFRDKIWHFFWNAHERFDDTSAGWLDFKGIAYELKSRSSPVSRLFKLDPLGRDATEDIVFNRGGIKFADWIMRNQKAVITHHYQTVEAELRQAMAASPEMSKLPEAKKDEFVKQALQSDRLQVEMKKRAYHDFAEYAAKHIEAVLEAIKTIPADVK